MSLVNSSRKLLAVLLAIGAAAQDGPLALCSDDQCDNCPNAVTTTGTGYPACVIYNRDTVLGGTVDDYEGLENDLRKVYFDVAPLENKECRTIIRSPAYTTDPNCGVPVFAGNQGGCYPAEVDTTFMVQFCCGIGDCGAAGAQRRDGGFSSSSSLVLRDSEGSVVVPHAVGDILGDMTEVFMEDHGLNSTSVKKVRSADGTVVYKFGYGMEDAVQKRDCDTYIADGAPYTKISSETSIISGDICDTTTDSTVQYSSSVSRSTTFGASVSDPFGIVSASIDFTIEESASQSTSYTIGPKEHQCGHITWTPILLCTGGTITGCDGGDQTGEVCTARRISDNEVDGRYSFVQTS